MGDINKEREAIKKVYPTSEGWAKKVDKMSPEQITAIYLRFRRENRLR